LGEAGEFTQGGPAKERLPRAVDKVNGVQKGGKLHADSFRRHDSRQYDAIDTAKATVAEQKHDFSASCATATGCCVFLFLLQLWGSEA
jgi:hypothetical protein